MNLPQLLLLLFMVNGLIARPSDERWLSRPPPVLESLPHGNVRLKYRYRPPPQSTGIGQFFYSHDLPLTKREDILIEGSIDPVTGRIDITYTMHPGKVNVTYDITEFTITIVNLTVADRGRYLTDVNFDGVAALNDDLEIKVYYEPSFTKTPPNDIILHQNNSATFLWNLSDQLLVPPINLITLTHTVDNTHVLVHQRIVPESNSQEVISFTDEQQRFKGRLFYTHSAELGHIEMGLQNAQPQDNGQYFVEIKFDTSIDSIKSLRHGTRLHVITDSWWKIAPSNLTYVIMSRDSQLTFQPDPERYLARDNAHFELYKYVDGITEVLLTSVSADKIEIFPHKEAATELFVQYDKQTQSMVVNVINSTDDNAGIYTIKVRDGSENYVMLHQFELVVLNAEMLEPDLDVDLLDTGDVLRGSFVRIRVNDTTPKPDIIVYDSSNSTNQPPVPECYCDSRTIITKDIESESHKLVYAHAKNTDSLSVYIPEVAYKRSLVVALIYDIPGLYCRIKRNINISGHSHLDLDTASKCTDIFLRTILWTNLLTLIFAVIIIVCVWNLHKRQNWSYTEPNRSYPSDDEVRSQPNAKPSKSVHSQTKPLIRPTALLSYEQSKTSPKLPR